MFEWERILLLLRSQILMRERGDSRLAISTDRHLQSLGFRSVPPIFAQCEVLWLDMHAFKSVDHAQYLAQHGYGATIMKAPTQLLAECRQEGCWKQHNFLQIAAAENGGITAPTPRFQRDKSAQNQGSPIAVGYSRLLCQSYAVTSRSPLGD